MVRVDGTPAFISGIHPMLAAEAEVLGTRPVLTPFIPQVPPPPPPPQKKPNRKRDKNHQVLI